MRLIAATLTLYLLSGLETRADEAIVPKFLLARGQKGDKEVEFYSPIEIAINSRDEVFVTGLNNARLQKSATRLEVNAKSPRWEKIRNDTAEAERRSE